MRKYQVVILSACLAALLVLITMEIESHRHRNYRDNCYAVGGMPTWDDGRWYCIRDNQEIEPWYKGERQY